MGNSKSMPELSVVIVATDSEQRTLLQVLVDGTSVARTVHSCASFPVAAADPVMRRVQAATPDVLLVDIPTDNAGGAMRSIELLHQELPDSAIFAIGSMSQPQIIVSAGTGPFSATTDEAAGYARTCALNALAAVHSLVGLDKVVRVVKVRDVVGDSGHLGVGQLRGTEHRHRLGPHPDGLGHLGDVGVVEARDDVALGEHPARAPR